jgi:hypothetical protein
MFSDLFNRDLFKHLMFVNFPTYNKFSQTFCREVSEKEKTWRGLSRV